MILAHFTASDSASTLLVLGIGLLVFGARWRWSGPSEPGRRRRGLHLLGLGAMLLAGGLVVGFTHTGT